MNIISLESSNIKRIKALTITPEGNVVVIGGKNGQGKTSVLDSIVYALAGASSHPSQPVRQGEDKGRFVFYADHIADKAADLHNLLSTLADIRAALGVGDGPMLSELAGEIGKIKTERDAAVRERDAVVEVLKKCLAKGHRWHPCDPVVVESRAVLAKIEGERNA